MAEGPEILTIYRRIGERVDQGTDSFIFISSLLEKRAEIAEKFSQMLKDILKDVTPDQCNPKKDPISAAVIDEINNEVAQQSKLASELREKVINPSKSIIASMKDRQKALRKTLVNDSKAVSNAFQDAENARKTLDSQKDKLNQLEGKQRESQNKKVQKAAQEYQEKYSKAIQIANKMQQASIPQIHKTFGDYDANRLVQYQGLVFETAKLLRKFCEEEVQGVNRLGSKMNNFDPKDRSARYVKKVFDTTITEIIEDEELVAYAISDFRSEDPRDLQFVRGDKINVTMQHNSGWWEGEIEGRPGKVGTFPSTFIMMPGAQESKNDPIGAVFLVAKDYKKSKGGDIELLAGDLVYVDYVSKGRCSGTNLRLAVKDKARSRGYFPLDNLEKRI